MRYAKFMAAVYRVFHRVFTPFFSSSTPGLPTISCKHSFFFAWVLLFLADPARVSLYRSRHACFSCEIS